MQIDSRRIEEGDLFVAASRGRRRLRPARARARRRRDARARATPHAALATIAGEVRDRSTARVVAITGATGKTTTKDILAALCSRHARTVASEGNYNNELGVPLTLCRLEPDTEVCITEMGMRGLGQIAWLASFARPDVGLITNVAPVHLELVGTVANVARAKAELIEALPAGRHGGRPRGAAARAVPHARPTSRSAASATSRSRASSASATATIRLETSYTARHQLDNTLAALVVCDVLGIPVEDGPLDVEFSALREEELELPGGVLLINDCYNANPLSMRAALRAPGRARRRRAAASRSSARWPSSARRAAEYHRGSAPPRPRLGVDELIAVGPLAREYEAAANGVVDAPRRHGRRGGRRARGAAPARRRRARERLPLRWDSKRLRRN